MKNMKKALVMVLAISLLTGLLSGCSPSSGDTPKEGNAASTADQPKGETGEPVRVNMYQLTLGATFTEDAVNRMEDAVNKLLEERYGIKLNLTYLNMGDFSAQTNLALTTDEVDVVSIYSALTPLENYVANGQLEPLDKYWENATDQMKSMLTEDELKGMTLHGNLWALNRKYLVGGELRLTMDEDIVKEMGIDTNAIYDYQSISDVLYKVHEAHPEIYTLVPQSNNWMSYMLPGSDDLSLENKLAVLDAVGTNNPVVTSIFDNKSFEEWCGWLHQWYSDGLIMSDVLSNTTPGETYLSSKKAFACFGNGDIYAPAKGTVSIKVLMEPVIYCAAYSHVGYGISVNSKKKEAAWKLLEALYTDPEIANMVAYGIEGTDYVRNQDGTVDYPEGIDATTAEYGGVSSPFLWPNYTIMYPTVSQGADYADRVTNYNNSATSSTAVGFIWDSTDYKDQLTACNNVIEKYYYSLLAGVVDPEEILPRAREELSAAGGDEILASVQEQYNEFLAGK